MLHQHQAPSPHQMPSSPRVIRFARLLLGESRVDPVAALNRIRELRAPIRRQPTLLVQVGQARKTGVLVEGEFNCITCRGGVNFPGKHLPKGRGRPSGAGYTAREYDQRQRCAPKIHVPGF